MEKNEKTSKSVASKAAKILRDRNASADAKSVAASVLTQTPDRETKREQLQLFVGVNYRDAVPGAAEEKRIEAGFVPLGVLPPAFENELIERKLARIRLV